MMQFMDNVKLGDKSTIKILDPIRVSQASHTVTLRKKSEMYKDMMMKEFNKEVAEMSKTVKSRVSLYIVKAIHAFVKEGKKIINIPYFLSKFLLYFQLCIEIQLLIMNLTKNHDRECSRHYVVWFMALSASTTECLDSMNTPEDQFKDFIKILQK
jgi:hypothetical protein